MDHSFDNFTICFQIVYQHVCKRAHMCNVHAGGGEGCKPGTDPENKATSTYNATNVQLKIEFELKLKIEIFWLLVEKGLALMRSSNDKGQFVKNVSS